MRSLTSLWMVCRPTGSWPERGSQKLACHFKPKQLKLALALGAPPMNPFFYSEGAGAMGLPPLSPAPQIPAQLKPSLRSGRFQLTMPNTSCTIITPASLHSAPFICSAWIGGIPSGCVRGITRQRVSPLGSSGWRRDLAGGYGAKRAKRDSQSNMSRSFFPLHKRTLLCPSSGWVRFGARAEDADPAGAVYVGRVLELSTGGCVGGAAGGGAADCGRRDHCAERAR